MARKNSNFVLVDHPLVHDRLTQVRCRETPSSRFRELVEEIGQLLAYEVLRDFETQPHRVDTPLESFTGRRLSRPITIVPILRAGLGLAAGVMRVLPEASVGHIGMFRNEANLSPVSYFEKLPVEIARGPVILVDPMLATGGSAMAAVQLLTTHGCRDIRLVCLVAAPEGLQRLQKEHPKTRVYAAALDRELDDRGFILPGLGDAGDRLFGTTQTG